jgi:hypothetical protein
LSEHDPQAVGNLGTGGPVEQRIEETFRDQWGRLLALLVA